MEWVYTVAKALHQLGGKAHSREIAQKCSELGEQATQDDLPATVRDALQRYSADSKKGKRRGILRGSHRDVFKFDPASRQSVFEFSSSENPIFRFISGDVDIRETREILISEGADNILIAGLDEKYAPDKSVFVREHWRNLPETRIDPANLPNDDKLFPAAAWCTNTHLEVELASGVKLSTPIGWYPRLLAATQLQRANIELSPCGVHWPDVDEDISIINMLLGTQGVPPKEKTS